MKKIAKIIAIILLGGVATVFIFRFLIGNYFQYHGADMGIALSEKYTTISGRFDIGKQLSKFQICDSYIKFGCLNGELKGIKIVDNYEAFVYFKIDESSLKKYDYGTGYTFNLFGKYDQKIISNKEDLPKFGWIIGTEMELFSDNNLHYLIDKESSQFKELEKNPKIIINGVDYTK